MGAAHISAVYATWQHLPAQPFRLLTYMALVVPDAHTDPRFWKGRRALAFGLGRGVGKDEELPKATVQAVKRNVQILTRAGAITPVFGGYRGKNVEYRLNLINPGKGVADRTPLEPQADRERGTESDPERGTESDPKGVHISTQRGTPTDPPRREKRRKSESEEEISPSKVSPEGARDLDAKTDEISPFEASKILHEAGKQGVNIVALIDSAPPGLTTKTQRRAWAARQLLAKESA